MPTFNADTLPASTGFNLGSAAQRWDGFFQQVAVGWWNNIRIVDGNQFTTIQAAIDDITSTGTVFLPPGIYQEQVTLKTGVWLIGSGWSTTIIKAPDGLPNLLQGVVQFTSAASNVGVFNLQIDGNKSNQTAGRKVQGIYFFNATRGKVSNLFVHDTEDHAIHFRDDGVTTRPGNEIVGNFVQNAGLSDGSSVGGDGIVATACDHFLASRNTVLSSLRSGIHLINGCTESAVFGNICRNNGQGTAGSGIRLSDSGTANTGIIVSTNRCFDDQGTKTQDYGLSVENASDKITLGTNDFTGNQTGDVNSTTSGTVTQFMDDTSAQTIAGVKTFSSIPILPASNPTTSNQAARKAYVDLFAPLAGANFTGDVTVSTKMSSPELQAFTTGGTATVRGGPGNPISTGSDGGDVALVSGNGDNGSSGSNRNGGDVTMTPGSSASGGSAGTVVLNGASKLVGNLGFFNTTPIAKPTVTGSRGGNAALTDLLTELANLGLLTDSSS